jgi:hypothetical protein
MNIITDYNFCLLLADMEFDSEHVIGTQVLIKTDILENSYYFLLSICENENATQMQIPQTDDTRALLNNGQQYKVLNQMADTSTTTMQWLPEQVQDKFYLLEA